MDRRVAVVTGANKGIGREIARQLAREGITVFIGARDEQRGREAAEKLRAEGLDVRPLRLDVTDDASIAAAAATLERDPGRLDILVNNAGSGDLRPMHMVDDKTWHRLIDVNLTGTFNGMRAAVPLMLEAGGGAIVNNASVSGMSPTRNEAAYSAAKAAVVSLTKSGALEYGPTIRVNCVSPGNINTTLPSTPRARRATQPAFGRQTRDRADSLGP